MTTSSDISIASFWIGERVGGLHALCLRSWVRHGVRSKLFTIGGVKGVPEGIMQLPALDFHPNMGAADVDLIRKNPSGFSNLFRAQILAMSDVLWLDTDVLMLNRVGEEVDEHYFGWEGDQTINGAVLRLPRESDALRNLTEKLVEQSGKKIIFGDLGPRLLTSILTDADLLEEARPKSEFYEIAPTEVWKLYSKNHAAEIYDRLSGKQLVHLWNETLKLAPVNISLVKPQVGSFLHEVDREFWDQASLTSITDNQLRDWSRKMIAVSKRNEIARMIPQPLRRGLLTLLSRKIPAGY